ncbi:membrane-associated phospholipid phosphatase [Noviherbaspirillum sp.]|jgi:hypothetical protein|uniref:membrane-associated phospholipid phosphatase n=1 Tax=Noviherbaspirillum sp. TaxID=1926288 RepID=UPI0025CE7AE0|nr:membrane-associated phospholipid phosphatase [Noviherbaspirillum sp.]
MKLVYVGGTSFMLPAAAAIGAWLLVSRGYRVALWWSLLFLAGLGLIIASKMAFMGWGVGIPSIEFRAMSGHAYLTTSVAPVGMYLLLQGNSVKVRAVGVLLGIAFSLAMGACLAFYDFHSIPEIVGGTVIGGAVSLGFIRKSASLPTAPVNPALLAGSALVFLVVWQLRPGSLERWMVSAALHLSGNEKPFITRDSRC